MSDYGCRFNRLINSGIYPGRSESGQKTTFSSVKFHSNLTLNRMPVVHYSEMVALPAKMTEFFVYKTKKITLINYY